MALAGRVPAADGQVTGQVLVPDGLVANGRHFGLTLGIGKRHLKQLFEIDLAEVSAGTDLQPDVLGGGGDGRDLEAGLAVLGDELAGVDVLLGCELGLDANSHAVRRAPVWVGHLDLRGSVRQEAVGKREGAERRAGERSSNHNGRQGLTFPL